jgi:hypothetical protein
MDELIQRLNAGGARYLLIGGQAMRLAGMPRFSMDWDFYIPARDLENLHRLNSLLGEELDMPLDRSVRAGRISFRPIRLAGVSFNSISACRARQPSTWRKTSRRCDIRRVALASSASAARTSWLRKKRQTDPRIRRILTIFANSKTQANFRKNLTIGAYSLRPA